MTETREDVTRYHDGELEPTLVPLRCMCTRKLSHQMPSTFKLRGLELIMPCVWLWFIKEHANGELKKCVSKPMLTY